MKLMKLPCLLGGDSCDYETIQLEFYQAKEILEMHMKFVQTDMLCLWWNRQDVVVKTSMLTTVYDIKQVCRCWQPWQKDGSFPSCSSCWWWWWAFWSWAMCPRWKWRMFLSWTPDLDKSFSHAKLLNPYKMVWNILMSKDGHA